MLEAHVAKVSAWIDGVHTETAATRIADSRSTNKLKASGTVSLVPATQAELTRAARHEASHAVVGHALGLQPTHAHLRSDASGAVGYAPAADTADKLLLHIVADLAGVAFELLTHVDESREQVLRHSHDTLAARVRLDALRALAPDWNVTAKIAVQLSLSTVAANLDRIFRIAAALRALGELSGAEISALCGAPQ